MQKRLYEDFVKIFWKIQMLFFFSTYFSKTGENLI